MLKIKIIGILFIFKILIVCENLQLFSKYAFFLTWKYFFIRATFFEK